MMQSFAWNGMAALDQTVKSFDLFKPELPVHDNALDKNLAREILENVLQFRRSSRETSSCDLTCTACQQPHLSKITAAMRARKPIPFVLPAFPGKSPNLTKVLGPLPDMAERLALQFLQQLCDRIQTIYAPGAVIILCSDGRVFSDIIGMNETDVTRYQQELQTMISELGLTSLSTFNLDEVYKSDVYAQMRGELMQDFSIPQEVLRERVQRDEDMHRMYCGITRFLVEDATYPGQLKSRTAIQKECKLKAYEVIRRSNAWSELISERFSHAVRLSIHPQRCGSNKLGIRLIGSESWMTPWHGVALNVNGDFTLLKRAEAEALGARLVFSEIGRPSHFELFKGCFLVQHLKNS